MGLQRTAFALGIQCHPGLSCRVPPVRGFFRHVIESGAHSVSLEMVMAGRVDATAVDSTVLEWLSARHHDVARKLRVIETIGPSPIPPWVISRRLPERLCREICHLLRACTPSRSVG